jgi:putative intracellular protease/amidase
VADAFQDSEYFLPKIEIEKLGVETEVLSLKREPVEIYSFFARIGLLDVHKTIGEADPSEYAGVLVPGGAKSPAILSESKEALSFLREIDAAGKLIAPICRGSLLVANSGIVKGRRMTGFHMGEQWPELVVRPTIEKFGGIWVGDQPVVVDGNLISSRHPDDVAHFIGAIRDWLKNAPKATGDAGKGAARARVDQRGRMKSLSTKATRPAKARAKTEPASRLIDQRIRDLGGWRGETLARMRALILEADPEMTEERKWIKPTNPSGVPVWSHAGLVCTGEAYAKVVKLTFARGASIPDPSRLFNSSLEGKTRRAIDIHEGEKVNGGAFKALVKAAVTANAGTKAYGPPKAGAKARLGASEAKPIKARKSEKVLLLPGS